MDLIFTVLIGLLFQQPAEPPKPALAKDPGPFLVNEDKGGKGKQRPKPVAGPAPHLADGRPDFGGNGAWYPGFAGNIALKTAEGTARQLGQYLRAAMNRTWAARLGYLLARQAFQTLREKMDPRKANGGVFLGLNGIVIKSHGGADAEGFAAAIELGHGVVCDELLAKIRTALEHFHKLPQQVVGGAAS